MCHYLFLLFSFSSFSRYFLFPLPLFSYLVFIFHPHNSGLYKGFVLSTAGVIPSQAIYITTLELVRNKLTKYDKPTGVLYPGLYVSLYILNT